MTAPGRYCMIRNGAPSTSVSLHNRMPFGARGNCFHNREVTRNSRAMSFAPGGSGPSGGLRNTCRSPSSMIMKFRFPKPPMNC